MTHDDAAKSSISSQKYRLTPMATKHSNKCRIIASALLIASGILAAVFLVGGGIDLFGKEASNPICDDKCQMAPVVNENMVTLMTLKEQARVEYIKERTDLGLSVSFDNSIINDTVTTCIDGFAGEYPCSNIDLHSLVSFPDLGCLGKCEGTDMWGWVDPQTGNEYALMATNNGIAVVDVTDSLAPQTVAFVETPQSGWHDVKVFNNHMFSVTEGKSGPYTGMQVFDLTRVRGRTTLANMNANLVYTHEGQLLTAHNIVINEDSGFAYVVGSNLCSGGLYMLDISSPLTPQYVGCYTEDGYTHDAQCVIYNGPHTAYNGREICFAYNQDTLTIVDVTDKSSPVMISRTGYEGSEYTHQGWLTPDMKFVLLGDEYDEYNADAGDKTSRTWLVDCANLTLPIFVTTLSFGVEAIDHNQYITDDWFSFQSNFMAGLRILDLIDMTNIFETAFFDVDPAINQAKFHGSWSNYPYFPSGNIIVSSMERGLFVVQPTNLSRRTGASLATAQPTILPFNSTDSPTTTDATLEPTRSVKQSVQPSMSPTAASTTKLTSTPTTSLSSQTLAPSTGTGTFSPRDPPSIAPTATPTGNDSQVITLSPTLQLSKSPTTEPASIPTASPSIQGYASATGMPTTTIFSPRDPPSATPTMTPTYPLDISPSFHPSMSPTATPTMQPTSSPTSNPSAAFQTFSPSVHPSSSRTTTPTTTPSILITLYPSVQLSNSPTNEPTFVPTNTPTDTPSVQPSFSPTSEPTYVPTSSPSNVPTFSTTLSTFSPTPVPTSSRTDVPTKSLTKSPSTEAPTELLSVHPTLYPTKTPSTNTPSQNPSSSSPTHLPSVVPTFSPSTSPSTTPTTPNPTRTPNNKPSLLPSATPSVSPGTASPSTSISSPLPSEFPTTITLTPTSKPSLDVAAEKSPTNTPSNAPSLMPSLLSNTSAPTPKSALALLRIVLVIEGKSDELNAVAKSELESILKASLGADACSFNGLIDDPVARVTVGGARLLLNEDSTSQPERRLQSPTSEQYGASFLVFFTDANTAQASESKLEQDGSGVLNEIQTSYQERRFTNKDLPSLVVTDVYIGNDASPREVDNEQADTGLGENALIGLVSGCIVGVCVLALVVVTARKRRQKKRREQREAAERASNTLPEALRRTLSGDVLEAISNAKSNGELNSS